MVVHGKIFLKKACSAIWIDPRYCSNYLSLRAGRAQK